MPVALPDAFNHAGVLPVLPASRRRNVVYWITQWLKRAERRRAERLIAQQICDAGICDCGEALERGVASWTRA